MRKGVRAKAEGKEKEVQCSAVRWNSRRICGRTDTTCQYSIELQHSVRGAELQLGTPPFWMYLFPRHQ